jgi:hypothetical protein
MKKEYAGDGQQQFTPQAYQSVITDPSRAASDCSHMAELSFLSGRTSLAQAGQVKLCYKHYVTPERTYISI